MVSLVTQVCGIGARTASKEQGFWVMFEPKEAGARPHLELLPKAGGNFKRISAGSELKLLRDPWLVT